MKTIRTKAIVLRRTNYGEADRIVLFVTPEYGLISAIAKGVRREKSKLAGGIELLAVCDITLHQGKSDLMTLTSARAGTFFGSIIKDYERLQFCYEAMKQVRRAAETIDDEAFYQLLEQTLMALDDDTIGLEIIRAWFWLQLAILLGTGVNLETDDHGMKLVEDARYEFDAEHSVFHFKEQGRFTAEHIKLLRILSAQPPGVASKVSGLDDLLSDCLWVAERAVAPSRSQRLA